MNKSDYYYYPAIFGYELNNKISVYFPDLDVATSGDDDYDALKSARELLGVTMWGIEDDNEPIPQPLSLNKIKCRKNERVVLVDVFMPSVRMAENNRSVNRTVTIPAWLNATALKHHINFSQVLQEALREKLHV